MFTNQTIVSTDPPSVTSAQEARTNASTTGDTEHIFVVTTYWWDVGWWDIKLVQHTSHPLENGNTPNCFDFFLQGHLINIIHDKFITHPTTNKWFIHTLRNYLFLLTTGPTINCLPLDHLPPKHGVNPQKFLWCLRIHRSRVGSSKLICQKCKSQFGTTGIKCIYTCIYIYKWNKYVVYIYIYVHLYIQVCPSLMFWQQVPPHDIICG